MELLAYVAFCGVGPEIQLWNFMWNRGLFCGIAFRAFLDVAVAPFSWFCDSGGWFRVDVIMPTSLSSFICSGSTRPAQVRIQPDIVVLLEASTGFAGDPRELASRVTGMDALEIELYI